MTAFRHIFAREFKSYFATPVAYLFLVVFLALASYQTFDNNFFEYREASLRIFFDQLPLLFAFFAPALAMRMWSEERRSGTIEFLLTLPVTPTQAVLGKFFASWAFFAVALLFTGSMVWTVEYLGNPDYGPILVGYIAAFLMAGAYLAVSMFCSALTKNQVISIVLGTTFCIVLVYAGDPALLKLLTSNGLGAVAKVFESISFQTNFEALQRGLLDWANVFSFVVIAAGFLWGTVVLLNGVKAR